MRKVIAIACSDIHLQHNPPRCRGGEPDWYEAMARPLDELKELQKKYKHVPILCAGDIFDKWNSSPELINWSIQHVPSMVAIPGQHDLPQHNYEDVHRSAYRTLVEAGSISSIFFHKVFHTDHIIVHGVPWGFDIPEPIKNKKLLNVLLIHEYFWIRDYNYPGAPKSQKILRGSKKFAGFDIVIIGDNHKGFITSVGNTNIINCGTMMRRKTDEADYRPMVGLVHDDGTITPHYLDTTLDVLDQGVENVGDNEIKLDVEDFLEELEGLQRNPLDFKDVAIKYMDANKTKQSVRNELLEAMES